MHPVLKRILLHGFATAVMLAVIGVAFAELAGLWMNQPGRAAPVGVAPGVDVTLRYRVPAMMAFWGFVFVAVCELVRHRFWDRSPKPIEPPTDDAERLLNELLAQAEAKMALEAESQKAEEQKAEPPRAGDKGQNAPEQSRA